MIKPIVSIIIATYNSESCIRQSLESVKNNSLHNWECIVVDGASTDGTIQVISEFKREDKRFRYISEPDKGIYDAFNKGWRNAQGDWIYYLGSDDKVMSDGLYGLISDCGDASIVYGDMKYDTGLKIKTKSSIPESSLVGNMPCHQSMIMKRELIESLDGFDMSRYKICADFDLFQRALKHGVKVKHIRGIVVACYNSLGASSGIGRYMKECFKIKLEYGGFFVAISYVAHESIKRILKTIYLRMIH